MVLYLNETKVAHLSDRVPLNLLMDSVEVSFKPLGKDSISNLVWNAYCQTTKLMARFPMAPYPARKF